MELNYAQALRDELAGLENRIAAMAITGDNTGLLERRVGLIREQLGEPAPTALRNGRPRGRETRPADGPSTPES